MLVNNILQQPHLLLPYWLIYSLICIPVVYGLMYCLPLKLRYKPFWPFIYLYLLAITVIFFGIIIDIIMVLLIRFTKSTMKVLIPASTASYPDYQRPPQTERAPYGEGVGFKMVTEHIVTKSHRKQMLVMMNHMEGPAVNKINQLVLEDSEDEIRLYAQSIMEKQEEKLLHLTAKFTKAMHKSKDIFDEARYKKVIASILWEQIYKGLTTHLNLDVAFTRIRELAIEAFDILQEDNELPILLAKIALKQKKYEEAKYWLRKAEANDAPDYKIISYVAEIAYYENNYDAVRKLLVDDTIIGLHPLTIFWMNHA